MYGEEINTIMVVCFKFWKLTKLSQYSVSYEGIWPVKIGPRFWYLTGGITFMLYVDIWLVDSILDADIWLVESISGVIMWLVESVSYAVRWLVESVCLWYLTDWINFRADIWLV